MFFSMFYMKFNENFKNFYSKNKFHAIKFSEFSDLKQKH